tara:strand:+ start:10504 stop:11541 length:1038 start_codon:yes stop_codon:yes gene_type:complete
MKTIVSIIIPHHNNSKILIDCINSLYKSTFEELEIIVVDNASTDSSCDDIMTTFPNVIVKKSDVNLGYAGGCNLGAQIANGQYLLFLNNDTIMDKNCVKSLVDRIKMNNEIVSVQPKILNINNKSHFDYAGASGGFIDYLVFPFTRGRIFDHIEKDEGQYDSAVKIFWASGAAFLTKKDIFIKLGGFDNNLFSHMEEIDYHWKCYLSNHEVWVEPKAKIYHYGGKTLPMDSAKKTYYNHRNSLILLLSNYSFVYSFFFFLLRIPLEIISSIKELITFRFKHFIYHYIAILWILFNLQIIFQRRALINKNRSIKDIELFNRGVIFKKSIVMNYFLLRKKTYLDLEI